MIIKHILFGAVAALTIAGCQQEEAPEQAAGRSPAGEAVAHVNGEPISKRMFEFHLAHRTGGQAHLAQPEQREELLKELIDMTLLAQEAAREGLTDDEEVAARLENVRSAVLAQALVEDMLQQQPDDAAIQAEYDQRFGGEQQVEYHARHILVEDKAKAEALIAKLDKGADFAKLAEENSTGPTGPNGGDLGWFQPQQMVPPFAEAVQKLEPGSYGQAPVETQFGWHVIKLEETRPVAPPPLDEVREQLAAVLQQQRVETHLADLRKQADVRMMEQPAPSAETASPVVQQPVQTQEEQPSQPDGAQSE